MKSTKRYQHLTKEERSEIEILKSKSYSLRDIAQTLKRNVSTISREIKRNRRKIKAKGGSKNGPYRAKTAQQKARIRKRYAQYQGKKIWENKELRECIEQGFKKHWSPDEISGRMKYEKQPFYASKTAIYEFLYSAYGQYLCKYLPSKRYRKRKRKNKKTKRALIPNRVGIEKRPEEANLKLKYGHFETDTIISGKKTGSKESLSVILERKARYIRVRKIDSLKPEQNNKAILKMAQGIKVFKTLTLDNGIENTKHEKLQKELSVQTFFCDPYSSWQKGGIENANRLIRKFIPKGTDIGDYSDGYIKEVCSILNNKPRKSLGYKTPLEVMIENSVLRTSLKQSKQPDSCLLKNNSFVNNYLNKKTPVGVALEG